MDNRELLIQQEIISGALLLRLTGDITKDSGNELLRFKSWESGLPEGIATLVIDFSEVAYINSAGIAALIRLFRIGSNGRYRSCCFGLHYHYEKLFGMVGLNKYLTIYPSEWSALERIQSNPE